MRLVTQQTLARQLDEAEREADKQDALRKMIDEALRRGQRNADAMLKRTRGMFGLDPSLDTLVLR